MLTRPRFKSHLQPAAVPDEGVFVLSGTKHVLLQGRLYELVAPHIDGRPADEICDRLAADATAAEVYFTLAQLERMGFLDEADDAPPAVDAAWWSMQQIDPRSAARRLAESQVSVHGLGIDIEPLGELLAEAGVQIDAQGEMSVVAVDDYLRPELESFNAAGLESGRPWLLVKPLGPQIWLGPVFRPGTACWKCLAERLRSNHAVESYLRDRQALTQPPAFERAGTSAGLAAAYGLAANAILSWLVRGELCDCEGKIRTFDQLSWQTKSHTLVKLPWCPACGPRARARHAGDHATNGHAADGHSANGRPINGDAGPLRPLVFQSCKKTSVRDGGHRVTNPETTLERFGHHVSPITGAVSMLERSSPAGDGTMHVYLAGHNLARRHRSLGQLQGDLRHMSAGKGTTDAQAKASGLCEGLERYSGVFRGDERRRRARLSDLGAAGIDLRECLLFSDRQFRERDATNARESAYNFVPLPFDPQAEIDWTPVWSVSRREVRYLPSAFCFYDYPQPKEQRFCIADSNGCAAGNTLEEAVLQGFLELVERDSVALWWYNRVSRPGVDLASFDEPYLRDLAESLAHHNREMQVIDLTSDLGIPVFAAWCRRVDVAAKPEDRGEQILLGFGAHLDPRIALLRAVTEMNQMLSHLLHAPLEKVYQEHVTDRETVEWLKTATAENQPYLCPAAGIPRRTLPDYQPPVTDDIAEDVRHCQSLVERQGLELLVLDQTRLEIGLPVVKVIVPGLRHFWARFAPGRLYEVPVQLGWLPGPLAEEALNPIPMFL
ncbi:MAG: TOMM precursor leader peptide-binding protein [Deltaproteobacteria bacterium]